VGAGVAARHRRQRSAGHANGRCDDDLLIDLPVRSCIKQLPVGCSGCATKAPFTLREFEAGPTTPGWRLRLAATEKDLRRGRGACGAALSSAPRAPAT